MTFRKITIDNSGRYIPQSEQIKESKPSTIRNRKQNKNISKNNKKIIKNFSAEGFGILTK